MTTMSLNAYYCRFCEWVAEKTTRITKGMFKSYKVLVLSQAAGELALAGYHDDAAKMVKDISDLTGEW